MDRDLYLPVTGILSRFTAKSEVNASADIAGGAFSMAERILRFIGNTRIPLAMSIAGYIGSIPVFGDSGYVILSPLNKALTRRANLSLAFRDSHG